MTTASVMVAGRYRLEQRLAYGGMGEVWRATDTVLGRPVAVKLLRAEYASHGATLDRFRAEARHAGSLSHPGIAQVYDYGEAGPADAPYLVMELVAGPPLSELLTRGPLRPALAMDLVAQVAVGLAAAHAAGLVHRDIKPGNLLLAPDGRIKITDFGIAHAAGSAPLTSTGTLLGTPGYLAPERVSGGSATAASDLYSLGIVAFECLAGSPPFRGTGVELAVAHRDQPLPPLPSSVPAPVAALVGRLTAKDPALRPGSAAEVAGQAEQLRDAISDGAGTAGHPTAAAAAADAVPAVAGTAGPAAGTAGPAAATRAYPRPDDRYGNRPPGPPGSRHRSGDGARRGRGLALAAAAVLVVAGLLGWLLVSALNSPGTTGRSGAAGTARKHATSGPSASPRPTPAVATVRVTPGTLVGQPVYWVRRQLTQLGLRVHVQWQQDGDQRPGTVLWVDRRGRVPVGSDIVVAAAFRPDRHGHHGHGDGNGNGNGDQGD
jgi:hypothetical protein